MRAADYVAVKLFSGAMTGRILFGATPLALIEEYTSYSGRVRALPAWAHEGVMVATEGGSAIVNALLAKPSMQTFHLWGFGSRIGRELRRPPPDIRCYGTGSLAPRCIRIGIRSWQNSPNWVRAFSSISIRSLSRCLAIPPTPRNARATSIRKLSTKDIWLSRTARRSLTSTPPFRRVCSI